MPTTIQHRLVAGQAADAADLAESLTEEQLDAPSLCEGWRVRDVLGHLSAGIELTLAQMLGTVARHGGSVAKASLHTSIAYADAHTPEEMAHTLREFGAGFADGKGRDGILRVVTPTELQIDTLIHLQDIRRPLGLTDPIPEERIATALAEAPAIGGLMKLKQRGKGLRLRATDLDWSAGDGPEVEGPAEALLLALSGRPAGLDELRGEGYERLAGRVKAAS
jgi:uncharacterized protein (TIGR03083 family)